jgi:hypothetical protein
VSWQTLADIIAEGRREAALEAARPLVDCPRCATTLLTGPRGELFCPWGDFVKGDLLG